MSPTIQIICIMSGLMIAGAGLVASQANVSMISAPAVKILLPETGSYTSWETIHIIVQYVAAPGERLLVWHNDEHLTIDADALGSDSSRFAHLRVALASGNNSISAQILREEQIIAEDSFDLFFWQEVLAGGVLPGGLSRQEFHTVAKETVCLQCHALDKVESLSKDTEYNEFCLSCHSKIMSRAQKHGPSQTQACIVCHEPVDGEVKYPIPDPTNSVCYYCHENNTQGKMVHGPTSTGKCTICHDPHSTDNAYFLKKPVWELCTTCHVDNATGVHVVAGFVFGDSHPTKGWEDPAQPGKDFSCASCHNPHSTDTPNLWKYGAQNRGQLCVICHPK